MFTFSVETWADACRRLMTRPPDRLLHALMTDIRVGQLLVANPFRSKLVQIVRRGRERGAFPTSSRMRLIQPVRFRRRDPTSLRAIERHYVSYGNWLADATRRMEMDAPTVITANPFVAGFVKLPWASSLTYYARDDWASYPPHERWWPRYRDCYERIRRQGHGVCAVSQVLLDRIGPTGPCAVVPNGVSVEDWERPSAAPAWLSALPHPRILYTGTIDHRLDVPALLHIAREFRSGSLIFVGLLQDPTCLRELPALSNVFIHPSMGPSELAATVYAADVCVIPHRRTALTEAMSPLKLYEYLAAGRPVVATDLLPMRDVDPQVILVDETQSYTNAIENALAIGPKPEKKRQEFIREHSWKRRHEILLEVAFQ